MHDAGDQAAHGAAGNHTGHGARVFEAASVERGFGDAAENAGDGISQVRALLIALLQAQERTERHTPGRELRDDAGDEDAGVGTDRQELRERQGGEHGVHAGHDKELPERRDDNRGEDADDAAGVAQAEQRRAERIAEDRAERGERAQADGNHDEHGEEGDEDGREHVGNDLLEEFLDLPKDRHAQDHGQDAC